MFNNVGLTKVLLNDAHIGDYIVIDEGIFEILEITSGLDSYRKEMPVKHLKVENFETKEVKIYEMNYEVPKATFVSVVDEKYLNGLLLRVASVKRILEVLNKKD